MKSKTSKAEFCDYFIGKDINLKTKGEAGRHFGMTLNTVNTYVHKYGLAKSREGNKGIGVNQEFEKAVEDMEKKAVEIEVVGKKDYEKPLIYELTEEEKGWLGLPDHCAIELIGMEGKPRKLVPSELKSAKFIFTKVDNEQIRVRKSYVTGGLLLDAEDIKELAEDLLELASTLESEAKAC